LVEYAQPLGMAFQLRDDLIDLWGDDGNADLRRGTVTAPVAHALAVLPAAERRDLESLIGADDPDAARRARELVERSGARAAIEQRIADLRRLALGALDRHPLRPAGRALLVRFADLLTQQRAS
jgi:geranylgeranyl diphosphate synthase type I